MSEKSKGSVIALIKLHRTDCEVTNFITKNFHDVDIKRLKIGENYTLHCISFNKDEDYYDKISELRKVSRNFINVGKNKIWAEGPSCTACHFMATADVEILSNKSLGSDYVLYRILVSNRAKLRELEEKMDEAGLDPEIIDITYSNDLELTYREKDIIKKLFDYGYFELDRKKSLTEIAASLGISTTTLSEIMRVALKKIVKTYINDNIS
ncbi:helix-turn-helix domain-containing protein [Acidiplasma sp.]|jgi:predicted DNA binding protein|uniref:helix-turn-helix domain-containing protein n=1 Tax=Acidiplasma TaxID=507753 RepID=UPI00258568CB|nr:helix-turn-helix domain-containing protein [Acidiplasma sp.]